MTQSNSLEVEVGFYVDTALIVLPAGLPGFEHYGPGNKDQAAENDYGSCLVLNCPVLQVQLRTNDHFMGKMSPARPEGSTEPYVRDVLERGYVVWGCGELQHRSIPSPSSPRTQPV